MSRRFAGDVFGGASPKGDDTETSVLTKYFPDLYNLSRSFGGTAPEGAPRGTGGFAGVPAFVGAKPMKKHAQASAPTFIKPIV
jgi:hypothetical protein